MLAGIWEKSEYKGDKRIAFAILPTSRTTKPPGCSNLAAPGARMLAGVAYARGRDSGLIVHRQLPVLQIHDLEKSCGMTYTSLISYVASMARCSTSTRS